MNKEELRALVAQMLQQQLPQEKVEETAQITPVSTEQVDDVTEINLRKQYLVENPVDADRFLALKAKTPARSCLTLNC